MMKRVMMVAVAALSTLAGANTALAVSGDINATATVLTPLTVGLTGQDLAFGNVFPGVNTSVAYTDASAGRWDVNGEAGAEVQMSMTLPAVLNGPGGATMPIVFNATDAGHNTTNAAGSATTFDPSAGATTTLDGTSGDLYVFVGGQVQPAGNQAAGGYSNTITLDVVYTGN